MFRRCLAQWAPVRDPFKVLGLTRSASKAQVKTKYRELARVYHPDAENGDSGKMEEVNHAYKLLMKEGGYERLHLRRGARDVAGASAARGPRTNERPTGVTRASREQRAAGVPFTADQETGGSDDRPHEEEEIEPPMGSTDNAELTDEEMEKLGALDPSTERRSPSGTFLYQSRDDQSWVELDRPLVRAHVPRYASHAAKEDMNAELRRRSVAREREQNEKTAFQRTADRLTDSADLPTKNPWLLRVYVFLLAAAVYFIWERTFARGKHHGNRARWYKEVEAHRADLERVYKENKDGLEVTVVSAALIFLAAAKHKTEEDPIQTAPPEVYFHSVRPPQEHFNVVAGG